MSDMVRKMQLVEVGELERLRQRQLKEYDPTLNAMARAQLELDEILANKKLTDEDKLALLSNAQQRFKKLKASIGPIVSADVAPDLPAQTPTNDIDADGLKHFLDKHPAVIRSNAAGELVFRNKAVPGSSYYQLLEGALGPADTLQPGFPEFVQGLKLLNAPRDIIKTEAVLDAYDSAPSTSTIKTPPASDVEDDKPLLSVTRRKSGKGRNQKGKGKAAPPPGKRPRILFLYK